MLVKATPAPPPQYAVGARAKERRRIGRQSGTDHRAQRPGGDRALRPRRRRRQDCCSAPARFRWIPGPARWSARPPPIRRAAAWRTSPPSARRPGATLGDAVKVTIYMTDMSAFAAVNEVYGSFFESIPPARVGDRGVRAAPGRSGRDGRGGGASWLSCVPPVTESRAPTGGRHPPGRAAGAGVVRETPVLSSRTLAERTGVNAALKAENLQRTGSFKLRGAVAKIASLGSACDAGVVTASAGNHAQAVAYAARERGVTCEVYMPESAPIAKAEATTALGAHVRLVGETVDEALLAAQRARPRGRAGVRAPVRRSGRRRRPGGPRAGAAGAGARISAG